NIAIAFEPEPGMFIERMSQFERLIDMVQNPALKLTLDIGHLHCLGDGSISHQIHRWKDLLVNIHIEDMRRGVHEHLRFGEGEIDFAAALKAVRDVGYDGGVYVELSRHGHMAPTVLAESKAFLDRHLKGHGT